MNKLYFLNLQIIILYKPTLKQILLKHWICINSNQCSLLNWKKQFYHWKSKCQKTKVPNEKFSFPLEVLFVVPLTFLLITFVGKTDRSLRLRLFYPFAVFMIGVAIPFYVIIKNKKMKKLFLEMYFEKPKRKLSAFKLLFKKLRGRCISPSIYPIDT